MSHRIVFFLPRWILLLYLVVRTHPAALAQFSGATVTGVVQDSSRAVIPLAKLKLVNTQTGTENDSMTTREGTFLLTGVLAGDYTLQVESSGFAITQVRGMTLAAGDTKNLLIRMKVGSTAETVTVDASGLNMNTTNAAVELVADQKLVENLPLNGRSFSDLILLTPGIVTQNPQVGGRGYSTVGEFSVNGQQPGANSFFVDGVAANLGFYSNATSRLASTGSIAGTTALGTTQSLISVDALQEFKVLTSSYSAEYGRTPGGQFNFVTRSGTNGFHGSVYEYYRHETFDAADYFESKLSKGNAYNQFDSGATIGGPLGVPWGSPDRKSYAFGSYEWLSVAQPTPFLFEYLPAYDVQRVAPQRIAQIIDAFGSGVSPEITNAAGQLTGVGYGTIFYQDLPSRLKATSIRFDQTLNPWASFFIRYGDTPSLGRSAQLSALSENRVRNRTVTFSSLLNFGGARTNQSWLGYVANNSTLTTNIQPYFPGTQIIDLVSLLGVPPGYDSVRGKVYIHADGAGESLIQTDQASSSLTQWNLRDIVVLPVRSHLIKIGVDERRLNSTTTPTSLTVQANFFDRYALTHNSVSQLIVSNSSPASPQIHQLSVFADDSWKLASRLNLSLGLRWELNPAPTGKDRQDAFTALGDVPNPSTLQLAPRGTPLWQTTWFNFAPRLGAAWIADNRSGHELVVRGGAGVFFDTSDQPALNAFRGIGFYASQAFESVPLPVTMEQLDVPTTLGPFYTNTVVFAFPRHLQLPYSLQWNFGIEQALGKYQSLTASYVGASGRRLLREQRTDVRNTNPDFGDVSYYPGGLGSNYEALQVKFQRTFWKGFESLASYTLAHSLDYGSTSPQFPLRYGSSDLDVRHNFEAGFTWTLPAREGSRISRIFVGRWAVNGRLIARTAFPVDLAGNFFFDSVTGTPYYSGVDLVPNRPLYYHSSSVAGGRGFNGGPLNNRPVFLPAFTLPQGSQPGNAPRNLLRGFSLVQVNIGAKRDFQIHDRLHLEMGGEIFNMFNRSNLGYIDPYLNDSVFGQSTRMLNQSFGPTGALYEEGGPLSGQVYARFTF